MTKDEEMQILERIIKRQYRYETIRSLGFYHANDFKPYTKYSLVQLTKIGVIPKPTRQCGLRKHKYYNQQDFVDIVSRLKDYVLPSRTKLYPGFYSITNLAKQLNCSHFNLQYHIKQGHIDAPTHLKGAGYYYTEQELKKAMKQFEHRQETSQGKTSHLLSRGDVAKELGVTPCVVSYWVNKGLLPPPNIKHGLLRYYERQNLSKLKEMYNKRKEK